MSDATVTVAALTLYPVKGCRGIDLAEATLAATGLSVDGIGDREWVVVDAMGEFLSQREYPKMALIETRMRHDALRLRAPGMLELEVPFASEGDVVPVRVWDDRIDAVTQGDIADAWISSFLGTPARLVRFDPEFTRDADVRYTGPHAAPFKFADAFALLVTGESSLADVNRRLAAAGQAAVAMARFRPNIVVRGLDAWDEDHVKAFSSGDITITPVKPCARCSVPGVDPATGESATVVPDLLASFRSTKDGVIFGVNAIVSAGTGATIRTGDAFGVVLDF
jgi:uncharacterized protein YcbX